MDKYFRLARAPKAHCLAWLFAIAIIGITGCIDTSSNASKDKPATVKIESLWDGEVDIRLRKEHASIIYISTSKQWQKLWRKWRPTQSVPAIDFSKQIVLVAAGNDPNGIGIHPTIDAQGNLTIRGSSAGVMYDSPRTFKYVLASIKREGILTVNGELLRDGEARVDATNVATHDRLAPAQKRTRSIGAVFFEPRTVEISQISKDQLKQVAKHVEGYSNIIHLHGHTSTHEGRGQHRNAAQLWWLAAARSEAVMDYMVNELGISKDRIRIYAWADTQPPRSTQRAYEPHRKLAPRRVVINVSLQLTAWAAGSSQ
jgi:flagellar motor protein MotB